MFWLVVSNQCTQKLQLKHYVTLSYKTINLKCRSATMPATTLQQTELEQNFETRLQGKRQKTFHFGLLHKIQVNTANGSRCNPSEQNYLVRDRNQNLAYRKVKNIFL